MKNAKRLLRKLDYLPRWAWYAMSLAIGGPVGPVVVYVAFHALQKAADDEDAEYDEWGAGFERREGGKGNAALRVTPRTRYRHIVRMVFDAICVGYDFLAIEYPEFIRYEMRG